GKTTAMRRAHDDTLATGESSSFLELRGLSRATDLRRAVPSACRGNSNAPLLLFLDGLDECAISPSDLIDGIRELRKDLSCDLRVCRSARELSVSAPFLKEFATACGTDAARIVDVEPLSHSDIERATREALGARANAFLAAISAPDLSALVSRPLFF